MKGFSKFTFSALLLFGVLHKSQAGWIKDFGDSKSDYGFWVEQTTDEGYVITGIFHDTSMGSSAKANHIYILKTDSKGDTVWTKTYYEKGFHSGRWKR